MATKTTSKTATKSAAKSTTPKATSAGRRKSTPATTAATAASRTKAAAVAMRSAAKAAAASAAPAPAAGVSAEAAVASAAAVKTATPSDAMRRPDLIQAVAERVSLRRAEAKMVFDVVLDEIGKALDANEEVIVPPLGKLMVKKRIEKPGGEMLTLKLKRAAEDPTAGDVAPLAKPAERS
jgi:nucleoid DNA-binding protein